MMYSEHLLIEGERIDDLQRNGLKIIQKENGFCFGTDAVLLSDFCARRVGRKAADMGTGTGVIPLLVTARNPDVMFSAFEIQKNMADMAARSVDLNSLGNRICVYNDDISNAWKLVGYESMDSIVTNPPYNQSGTCLSSPKESIALARGGTASVSVDEWIKSCGKILRNGGRFFCIYPAPKFLQICRAMKNARIEPKRVRFICASYNREPKLVLIEGIKGSREGLHFLPMLFTHNPDGSFSDEMKIIYGDGKEFE